MPVARRRGPVGLSGRAHVTSLIDQMLLEAEEFEHHLYAFEASARRYHERLQHFMANLLPLLNSNLPRVWVAVEGGLCEPVRSNISHGHPSRIGGDFDDEGFRSQLVSLEERLTEDILNPLKRWHQGLDIAKERMGHLDKLRLEVDRERQAADKSFRRAERRIQRVFASSSRHGRRGDASSSSSDEEVNEVTRGQMLEDYTRLSLVTERKLGALTSSYGDQERLVWEQLSGLVRDAAWLESYIAATMLLVKETMQGVALMLGPTKQPLPAYKAARERPAVEYGSLADNMALVQQLAPRAAELASGAPPRAGLGLQPPLLTLHAHRGGASPLSVAVSNHPRLAAMEEVFPVSRGAAHVPLALVGPEVRQEARRVEERARGEGIHVVEPPSSLTTPRATTGGASSSMAALPGPLPSTSPRPEPTTATTTRAAQRSTGMLGTGITTTTAATTPMEPRMRRLTDSTEELDLTSARGRRVTDSTDEGGAWGVAGRGLGAQEQLLQPEVVLEYGGLSAGAARSWQSRRGQKEPSVTPMGQEEFPSAAEMQRVLPRSTPPAAAEGAAAAAEEEGATRHQQQLEVTPLGQEQFPSSAEMQREEAATAGVSGTQGALKQAGDSVTRGGEGVTRLEQQELLPTPTEGQAVSAIQREVNEAAVQQEAVQQDLGAARETAAPAAGGGAGITSSAAAPAAVAAGRTLGAVGGTQLPVAPGERHYTPAKQYSGSATTGLPSMAQRYNDLQLRGATSSGLPTTSATKMPSAAAAAAPAGEDAVGHAAGAEAAGAGGPLTKGEAAKEEMAAAVAAAGEQLVFRPYPGEQAPGMVPHSHPVGQAF